jgi:archaemetzincin
MIPRNIRNIIFMIVIFPSIMPGQPKHADEPAKWAAIISKLRPLHKALEKPGPHDWLAHHHEPGQTFLEYIKSHPAGPDDKRRIISIQPIGEFTEHQRRIVTLTADFMGRFYNLPVRVQENIPSQVIPDIARRHHPSWGMEQILTTYILYDVLKPNLPADAVACIALTASDLWPGEGWNFVFGQASLRDRVGVWSMYRNGDPSAGEDQFKLCLLRTLKTAVHEMGHMFSIGHCIQFQCGMCGSNHREEADRRPLWFCPECMAKVCWITDADPVRRYRALAEFCEQNGLDTQKAFFEKSLRTLGEM